MPVSIKVDPANAPAVANSPEFQELLKQIEQAKSLLGSLGQQVLAIEAKMKPNTNKGAFVPDSEGQPHVTPDQESFEESIAEMRKIAGIK